MPTQRRVCPAAGALALGIATATTTATATGPKPRPDAGPAPFSATSGHGDASVEWRKTGDRYKDPDFGWFQIRNMLPHGTFHQFVPDTVAPGDEDRLNRGH